MKILLVAGARPQFIKLAPLAAALSENGRPPEILNTGQHYDDNMAKLFFDELSIPRPKKDLCAGSASHAVQTAHIMRGIEEYLLEGGHDMCVVFGDTNSTLAAALAAAKIHVPVAHVEAGLRSFNMNMPEEQNRVLTDRLSSILYCPSPASEETLKKEGIISKDSGSGYYLSRVDVLVSGDIMLDAVLRHSALAEKRPTLNNMSLEPGGYILSTVHRAENTDIAPRLRNIFRALGELPLPVIMPLHPRTKKKLSDMNIAPRSNIRLTEPAGYLDMLNLEKNAAAVITDSGGMQKEAYYLKTPCVTMRNETEWTETLLNGENRLASPDDLNAIIDAADSALKDTDRCRWAPVYGDGRTSELIREHLKTWA